ncbi:MAG: preprotein translocase subunit SecA [Candidatus Hinthialibacter antarcticus]|nr:preprotein translocase subunit SecA [Candidatus Hinthialibacter antarcticus]
MSAVQYVLKKIFGTKQQRDMRRYAPMVEAVNSLEEWAKGLSDGDLCAQTDAFRQKLSEGETLDDVLPEAFAVVRETSVRVLKMRHFDVQLIGGMVLYEGKIAEMATGEGKTLAATLPAYLHGLSGKGVHIVTVNDYLAKRDREWMGPLFEFLGLTVGTIQHDLDFDERRAAYACDITYGTNNEFGFDYLRDNMAIAKEHCVQRNLNFGIVDEVDSILVDEARTPLIISGPADASTEKYGVVDKVVRRLKLDEDFTVDEKDQVVSLTEEGQENIQKMLNVSIYDEQNLDLVHHVNQSLKAHYLFKLDDRYMIEDGEVVIVDEFTGRKMPGRRYSDGLHQAIEAKEGLKVQRENQTLATITFQNYFRLYEVLSGMTGTADTEAEEFMEIYKLEVVVIPTNRPMARADHPDAVYKTIREKDVALADEIEECHKNGQPALVGTVSIEKSEKVSSLLKKRGIKHHVLNAKFHEREAEIIAGAGQSGAVTIATNMAGRGTDIKLGEGVIEAGGLHIIGTERHESRRIDNQLRGRAGRQGDPGSSRFFLSLEDDLMRIFGGERIKGLAERFGMEEGEVLEHGMVSKAIANAQKRVEGHNFDIRKHILKYDDVMNKQREVIYGIRQDLLQGEDPKDHFWGMTEEVIDYVIDISINDPRDAEAWQPELLKDNLRNFFGIPVPFGREVLDWVGIKNGMTGEEMFDAVKAKVTERFDERMEKFGSDLGRWLMSVIMLRTVDSRWKEHLYTMDHLKDSVGLRAYGQKDPLQEYQKEGFAMFEQMYSSIQHQSVTNWFYVEVADRTQAEQLRPKQQVTSTNQGQSAASAGKGGGRGKAGRQKIKVNDPCPCGSGKKYKKCCMLKEAART